MGIVDTTKVATASIAVLVQPAASELWHNLVLPIWPEFGGPAVTALVGGCAAVIIAHFVPRAPGA